MIAFDQSFLGKFYPPLLQPSYHPWVGCNSPAQHPSNGVLKQSSDGDRDRLSAVNSRWIRAVGWSLLRQSETRIVCDDNDNISAANNTTAVGSDVMPMLASVRRVVIHIHSSCIRECESWVWRMNFNTSAMNFDQALSLRTPPEHLKR